MRSGVYAALACAVACLEATHTLAQAPDPGTALADGAPARLAAERIATHALRAHMRFLADDLLEGRGTGTRGYDLAGKYIASQFEALGLAPGGDASTYYQSVPLRRVDVIREQCSFRLAKAGNAAQDLVFGVDYIAFGSQVSPDIGAEGPIVFVGFGVTAPAEDYDDYAGVDARGKIVAYLWGAPNAFPSARRAHYTSVLQKQKNAAAHGAIGVISLFTPALEAMVPFAEMAGELDKGALCWTNSTGECADGIPQLRVGAVLSADGSRRLLEGAPRTYAEVLEASRQGTPGSFDLATTGRLRLVSKHSELKSFNVAGVLPGQDPTLRNEYVVYTAHADHVGIGRPVNGDAIYNGALDNASGVAALLEIARAFVSLESRPRRSLLFLAVTAEEAGLLGSDHFARNPTVPIEQVVANVNIDGVLAFYDFADIVALGSEHSSLGEVVGTVARALRLQVSPDPLPDQVFFIRSDQYSFVRQGVPALFMSEGFKTVEPSLDGRAIRMEWLKTHYHTPKDDMNQTLNWEAFAKGVGVNFLVGYVIAQDKGRPTWKAGDFFGQQYGRKSKTVSQ